MSYLADGLSQGFQSGFAAGTQKKRDKKQAEDQKARDVLQGEQQKALQNERLVADAQRQTVDQALKSSLYYDQQSRSEEQATADRAFRASEATANRQRESEDRATKASLYYDQQSRSEEQAAVERALKAPLMAEQARAMKLQNDAYGQPKQVQPMETLEYDPMLPDAPPKRRITGPLGSLGTITGVAAPAGTKPASVIDSFLTTPGAADPAGAPAAAPAARPGVFPAPPGNDADVRRLFNQFDARNPTPTQMAEKLAAAGIQVNPDAFRRTGGRTY